MKTPAVNYRNLRLSNLHTPPYRHLLLLWGWILYFILYAVTEAAIVPERCTPVHIVLDDWIPFCEWFVIPYVFWYFLILISLTWFLLYDIKAFCHLQTYIILVQLLATVIYVLYPTRQDLRPVSFPRHNPLTALVALLYRLDTNTGVCPSLHVAISLGIASVWLKQTEVLPIWKLLIVLASGSVCLSTVFIKQHSALDFFAALPVCLLAECLVFGKYYRQRIRKSPER